MITLTLCLPIPPTTTNNMGKIINEKINRFDGGMVNDPRSSASNVARVVTNFDTLSTPQKLIPYRSTENGDSSSTDHHQNFCLAETSTLSPARRSTN